MKTFEMTVRGRGTFPLDMLRYDGCYPSTSDDVEAIHTSLVGPSHNEWKVTLVTQHTGFTVGRWNSFGCVCDAPRRIR